MTDEIKEKVEEVHDKVKEELEDMKIKFEMLEQQALIFKEQAETAIEEGKGFVKKYRYFFIGGAYHFRRRGADGHGKNDKTRDEIL